jgi:hypothetical protein
MPTANCPTCAHDHDWNWEEAFDKFGFNDGDGLVMTNRVALVLETAGYTVTARTWGMHNTLITSIKSNGRERIPSQAEVGYDRPRGYLPKAIVTLLDNADYDEQNPAEFDMTVDRIVTPAEASGNAALVAALEAFIDDIDGRFGEVPEDCTAYPMAVAALAAAKGGAQ